MADGSRKRPRSPEPPLTHFLCIPLSNSWSKRQLEEFLDEFEKRLLDRAKVYIGKEQVRPCGHLFEGAIRSADTINLNLGAMSLTTEQQVREATKFLENLDLGHISSITESDAEERSEDGRSHSRNRFEFKLRIPDDQCGHGSILCLKLDASDRLKKFCEYVQSEFAQHGYIIANEEHSEDVLHAVVMNTTQAKPVRAFRDRNGKKKGKEGALRVNFRSFIPVMQYEGYGVTSVCLEKLAICKIKARKLLDDEGEVMGKELDEVASVSLRPCYPKRSVRVVKIGNELLLIDD